MAYENCMPYESYGNWLDNAEGSFAVTEAYLEHLCDVLLLQFVLMMANSS
jgi:hypothetical protein